GELDLALELARRIIAPQRASTVDGAPVEALAIDSGAVRPAIVGRIRQVGEDALVRRRAALGVVVPGPDRARRGVGVIHRPAVRAPGEAIRGMDTGGHRVPAPVAV